MTAVAPFVPRGISQLANALPETRAAESLLRQRAAALGIIYELPDYAGLRTPTDTAQLIRWRDEAVAAARKAAESKRRAQGGTAVQVKLAGDVAATQAYYRVAPQDDGFHGIGGAFDIRIKTVPAGMTVAAAYDALGALAPLCGLRWGGTFSAPRDIYHYELARKRDDVAILWRNHAATNAALRASTRGAVVPVLIFIAVLGAIGSFFATPRR